MTYRHASANELFAELTVHDSRETIKRALAAVRDLLGIDVVYLSSAGVPEAERSARPEGPATSVSIPLRFSDGYLYGTLECTSRDPRRPLTARDVEFMRVLGTIVSEQLERERRDLDVQRERFESMGLRALLAAIEARDSYTGEHCRSVVTLAVAVARELGLDEAGVARVEQVALLHDVGKVAVPDDILAKPGPLDEAERELVELHPVTGAQIVRAIPGLAHLAPAIRAAHERWDGRGYPDGLRGERIPLESRIAFVCDAYDAMTSDRPYRRSLGDRRAREELLDHAGSQFCRRAAQALLRTLEATPTLTFLRAERAHR